MKSKKIWKAILFWVVALFGGHLAASIIFGLAFNTIVSNLWRDGYETNATILILIYGVIIQIVFGVVYTVVNTRSVTYREEMKAEIREKTPVFGIFKKFYLKNIVFELPIYLVFLLPYSIFFAFQIKVDLANTFAFEKFYIPEMWAYVVTKNSVLGLIISLIVTFVILFAVRFIVVAATRKSLIENSVTLQ